MSEITVKTLPQVGEVAPEAWDALVGVGGCPFLEHGFLSSLEDAGCVGPGTGWSPRYIAARRGRDLVGALPLFRKDNGYGEFIFDWGWADAAQRAGIPYYPKMVVAAPFSPVAGPRFLLAPGEGEAVMDALLQGARTAAVQEPATGIHWLFITETEEAFLQSRGFAIRHTHQFHWTNDGYDDFDGFLQRFNSKRRNQIKRERRRVREAGVTTQVLTGEAITEDHIDTMWRYYTSTVDQYFYGRRYLNRRAFDLMHQRFRDRMFFLIAEQGGAPIGGTFNVAKDGALYGRYWGTTTQIPNLHFEVCSYAGIEAAIERGFHRFEAGAGGGGHKFGRGFLPNITRSAHEIFIPGLDEAIRRFVRQEKFSLACELEEVQGRVLKPR
ncbi:MAG: GNAT family N-acetyltransferase [Bradymonadia bacterium]